MKLFIDNDFKCHITNPDGAFREVETDFFDGKCSAYIEGFRFVPVGEQWTRSDGLRFSGEMVAPWQNFSELDAAQREYEQALIADMQQALATLGVTLDA